LFELTPEGGEKRRGLPLLFPLVEHESKIRVLSDVEKKPNYNNKI